MQSVRRVKPSKAETVRSQKHGSVRSPQQTHTLKKRFENGTGEMAWSLRAEDPSLVLSLHIRELTASCDPSCNPSCRASDALLFTLQALAHVSAPIPKHARIHRIKNKNKARQW